MLLATERLRVTVENHEHMLAVHYMLGPKTRGSRFMIRKVSLVGICVIALAYAGIYLFYRVVRPDAALGYVGGHVIRPSWFWFDQLSSADFTFSSSSRRWGSAYI